jgi:hypothetical protein
LRQGPAAVIGACPPGAALPSRGVVGFAAVRLDRKTSTFIGHWEESMLRTISMLLLLALVFAASGSLAQTKKPAAPGRLPTARDTSISINVFMRDGSRNELLLGTRIWPEHPDYNAVALQRFFALMKALEPAYRQDDDVAYTWSTKGRVTKCSIYLESAEAGAKTGTGAIVGCEANGVSAVAVSSAADPQRGVSSSQDPKHLSDVMDLFRKQADRARNTLPK